jgi:hypothetical protein
MCLGDLAREAGFNHTTAVYSNTKESAPAQHSVDIRL